MSSQTNKAPPTRKVVLVATSRTAIGKMGGALHRHSPAQLGAHVLKAAIRKAGLENLSQIDEIVFGHAVQSYYEPNTARIALQIAGLPESINCFTVHQQCASGMNSAFQVWSNISSGRTDLGIAVGVESMSSPPLIINGAKRYSGLNKWLTQQSPKALRKLFKVFGPLPFFGLADSGLGPSYLARDPAKLNMMKTAQIVGNLVDISREEADRFAARSHANALEAIASGRLDYEITPMVIPGLGVFKTDEHPRVTDLKSLGKLATLAGTGLITAGNASGMGDGACALVMCSEELALALGLEPLAEIADFCFTGRDAVSMGLGPVEAVRQLLAANGLTADQIDYWELNEAFSHQVLAVIKCLGIDLNKVNKNGGGISLSHPLGMTGARIIGAAAWELALHGGNLAVASLCVGGGMAGAVLIKPYQK
ncbi:MAG: thiolase family protein [Cyanobacteria bacterium SZAS LIN-2]|nr:thiolase family protein [Cyanobacteria bacterium SZAS LIN-3]MBS1995503.1 thiolase family protein [Cyanobacteria bacterium SZAS LIN-2]MBS2009609.1 thiolase family protein [Cyanobacteria bacterium SZAS TMP-1]